jgi:hypothetical protein
MEPRDELLGQIIDLIPGSVSWRVDLSIFRAGLKKIMLFRVEKILLMTIPLDAAGLNFRAGLRSGLGLAGRPRIL